MSDHKPDPDVGVKDEGDYLVLVAWSPHGAARLRVAGAYEMERSPFDDGSGPPRFAVSPTTDLRALLGPDLTIVDDLGWPMLVEDYT